MTAAGRDAANLEAAGRLCQAEPVLMDVRPALEVVPGMTPSTILTSGPPMDWAEYTGGQRRAILNAALFERLASEAKEAEGALDAGRIQVEPCHAHGCVGSVAGVYTASMPVFVVENAAGGTRGFCNFYEGESRRRLNYGAYGDDVRERLLFIQEVLAPVIGSAARAAGGIPLRPIMERALHMGDELHSRNTAATLLFTRELFPHLLDLAETKPDEVRQTLRFLADADYFFLRLSMASGKAAADAAQGVEGSSVVTAMTFSCRGTAIRVSGLGERWFHGPHLSVAAKLFEGFTESDIEWIGGESLINETVGLGAFAQAAAFPLQAYQGGSPQAMVEMNLAMYEICVAEHPVYRIPYLGYRGTPVGIDVFRVVETGVTPAIDAGIAGRDGGQIGAGIVRMPMEGFREAVAAFA